MHKNNPYELNDKINELIDELECSYSLDLEKEILSLLNRLDSYPDMSRYQLSLTRKRLADYYAKEGITGNALELYSLALADNKHLPVKRALASLKKVPRESLAYSVEVNYISDNDIRLRSSENGEEYDPAKEELIEKALDILGPDYKSSFYHERSVHDFYKTDEPKLPNVDWDLDLLKSMAESKRIELAQEKGLEAARNFRASVNAPAIPPGPDLSEPELLFIKYIHHKRVSLDYIPGYFTYEYHLDYFSVLQRAFLKSLLRYAPASFALSKMTIAELKGILEENGISASGKKNALIDAIKENADLGPYEEMYYELTESGVIATGYKDLYT